MTGRKLNETELGMLKIIWTLGGETTERVVAEEMKVGPGWARVYLGRLGRADLIDVDRTGMVRLTWKGRHALGVPEPGFKSDKPTPIKTEPESIQASAIRSLWVDRREGWG